MRSGSSSSSRASLKVSLRGRSTWRFGFGARPPWSGAARPPPRPALAEPSRRILRRTRGPCRPAATTRVLVTALFRKSRSWLTRSSVPVYARSRSSSRSSVSESRSLVGSSITSTLQGRAKSFASSRRLRSPPERTVHRRGRALRREEEVLQVADDVAGAAVDDHRVASVSHVLPHGLLRVELFPELVEVENLQVAAEADGSLLRRQVAEEQAQQRGLSRTVRADDADLVPPHDRGRELADDRALRRRRTRRRAPRRRASRAGRPPRRAA